MSAIDLITALGRLLQHGPLRDAFTADPVATATKLAVLESDRAAFIQLAPDDIEYQARVLLRKRFGEIRRAIPSTCVQLGEKAWAIFHEYARAHWPATSRSMACDAYGFCQFLLKHQPDSLCRHEWNRVRFANGNNRLAVHFVRRLPIRNSPRCALQLLVRNRGGRWHEFALYLGL